MESLPRLISDLALILFCAGLMSLIFKKLKQPVVLGYIVAGFLAGPYMPYTATILDIESIKTWADIGVIFLLFSLGLEFSFKKLLKIGSTPIIAVITSLICMLAIGSLVAWGFGWSKMDGLYLGGMIAIASTSIIIKSFEYLGVKQKKFATLVFSVLILEDIIAIILMLLFGTLGKGGNVDGEVLVMSLVKMVFYLVLWFVAGIYLLPLILKKTKKFLNNETLLIVSLGFCFLMVVAASLAGFSAAFGAFVMGSILAETTESEHIEHITTPIKDLFGAIFFVSVGMMINPAMIAEYWLPILVITAVVLILRSIVETSAFLLGGANINDAIHCGFSLAQVGEFAFIIATLGVSLGAIRECLYPIIVSVSVITTFTSPYMIKLADPVSRVVEPLFPKKFKQESERNAQASDSYKNNKKWMHIFRESAVIILIYTVLCIAVIALCDEVIYPMFENMADGSLKAKILETFSLPDAVSDYIIKMDLARFFTLLIALLGLLIFIRPLLTKGLFDDKFWNLWKDKQFNRAPLVFVIILRGLLAVTIVAITIESLYHSIPAFVFGFIYFIIVYLIMRRKLISGQKHMENVFNENYNSKENAGKPKYAGELLESNVHLSEIEIPFNSVWCGKSIKETGWGNKYGVHIASIIRESGRINIPSADMQIFPGDKVQLLGSDEHLQQFATEVMKEENLVKLQATTAENIMHLVRIAIPDGSVYAGTTVANCKIREEFHCMIVGIDRGEGNLIKPLPAVEILAGDIILVVGEPKDVKALQNKASKVG